MIHSFCLSFPNAGIIGVCPLLMHLGSCVPCTCPFATFVIECGAYLNHFTSKSKKEVGTDHLVF